jgi:tetratricopeptide (TPR) repeat protein
MSISGELRKRVIESFAVRQIRINIIMLALLLPGLSSLWAQEDLASTEEMIIEQQNINFQTFFFEALSQKAIGNFDKAIYALEACHDIDKNNVAVLFELSKNYGYQFKYTEAEYYAQMGLDLDPENIYLLRHLKEIKTKQNDFKGAIRIQQMIIEKNPEEEADLIILYIKSGDIDQAVNLLKKLDAENNIPEGLIALKQSLLQENNESEPLPERQVESQLSAAPISKSESLLEAFERDKTFQSLVSLLERELKRKQFLDLLEHSEEGISLFPAQPYIYLMKGSALNQLRKYDQAIETLEEGLEYLVDDPGMESEFLEQISLGFKGMGDNKKASEYYNRALEMKEKS